MKLSMACQLGKTKRKMKAGVLQPLPTPDKPWRSASMDFIWGFPSVSGCKSTMVLVDYFSKSVVLIPVPGACPTEEAVKFFHACAVKKCTKVAKVLYDNA